MTYQPPFTVSSRMIHLISQISEKVGRVDSQGLEASPQLRKQNRIKTITSTLAIEGNTLSMEQVTAIIEGRHVLGEPKELAEVRGAISAYEKLGVWSATAVDDFLNAHRLLMDEILRDAGSFRNQGVGIHKGKRVVHIAPPAERVPALVDDLFSWAKTSGEHALIISSIVHYELEFIHPFMDGNGRMGRLWQTLILGQWKPIFNLLPLESVIKDRQQQYYDALEEADNATDSRVFIEFILEAIDRVLEQNIRDVALANDTSSDHVSDHVSDQVKALLNVLENEYLSRQEIMQLLLLSHRPTFSKNYLKPALAMGLVEMKEPNSPRSPTQKYRKVSQS